MKHHVAAVDHRFLLEVLYTRDQLVGQSGIFADQSAADMRAVLDRAAALARRAAAVYEETDREGVQLAADGWVQVPHALADLWPDVAAFWRQHGLVRMRQRPAGLVKDELVPACPPLVLALFREILLSANPALMTYCSFNYSANLLLDRHGTPEQQELFGAPLLDLEWDACFCATEAEAGSDLTAITAEGELDPSRERYAISGTKRFISAAGHKLTANTVYFMLARVKGGPDKPYALTCFLVPRAWPGPDGQLVDNGVRVECLPDKMGLRASPNPTLSFGRQAPTYGVPLGGKVGAGLMQLRSLMNGARFGTGLIALALSAEAYQRSWVYAQSRIQGRPFGRELDPKARSVPIAEHEDVRRMLLEMRARVDGGRLLVARACAWQVERWDIKLAGPARALELVAVQSLIDIFNPMVKAYLSDQSWRVMELAIQVHGGVGYLKDLPLEAQARDCKVLSIWEGTNGIQALTLMKDRLHFCAPGPGLRRWRECVADEARIDRADDFWPSDSARLRQALAAFEAAALSVEQRARRSNFGGLGFVATRLLEGMTETTMAWLLLQAARKARQLLDQPPSEAFPASFLQEKIESFQFFARNILPQTVARLSVVADPDASV